MALQVPSAGSRRDGRELRLHGTPEFPCAGYLTIMHGRDTDDIGWHWHEELEVVYVQAGSIRFYAPGATMELEAGCGAFINANVLHMAHADEFCELHSLVFRKELLTGGDDTVFAKRYVMPIVDCHSLRGVRLTPEGDAGTLYQLHAAFRAQQRGALGHELAVRAHLSQMWLALYLSQAGRLKPEMLPPVPTENRTDTMRLKTMMEFIHSHYGQAITLEQVAQSAAIGQRECLRCFRRTIGVSPMQYLLKYRVGEAAGLLRTTALPISEVALQCGFDSPSNFAQAFKRFYGVTPRAYRQADSV